MAENIHLGATVNALGPPWANLWMVCMGRYWIPSYPMLILTTRILLSTANLAFIWQVLISCAQFDNIEVESPLSSARHSVPKLPSFGDNFVHDALFPNFPALETILCMMLRSQLWRQLCMMLRSPTSQLWRQFCWVGMENPKFSAWVVTKFLYVLVCSMCDLKWSHLRITRQTGYSQNSSRLPMQSCFVAPYVNHGVCDCPCCGNWGCDSNSMHSQSPNNGKNVARDTENVSFLWGVAVRTDVESVGSAACNVGVTSRHGWHRSPLSRHVATSLAWKATWCLVVGLNPGYDGSRPGDARFQ
jgi:hypothetical protein